MSAQRFVKKPVEIEAWHWTGAEPSHEFLAWIDPASLPSDGVHVGSGVGYTPTLGTLDIPTLEGTMTASPGDWIIRGVKGEFYPCKPDIFEATYEPVAAGGITPRNEPQPEGMDHG